MRKALALSLLGCAALAAQSIPAPTQTPAHPFFIKKTWIIGGLGNWDYLTMDPQARQLLIAHGPVVQVVDVETGSVAGEVTGLREAHAVALDDTGQFGYVSDGPAGQVKVFDRRTFKVVATIDAGASPRALVFEPVTKLLFAIGATPAPPPPAPVRPGARPTAAKPEEKPKSTITVMDSETRQQMGEIVVAGRWGFAQSDGNGQVYVNVVDRNQVARLDAEAVGSLLRRLRGWDPGQSGGAGPRRPAADSKPLILDWSGDGHQPPPGAAWPRFFLLGADCREPHGLAVDARHLRLFAACNNMKMAVLNADTGVPIASLPIGPGPDAIGYDAGRGLIYSSNGGAQGSLTAVRQDVTDTYAVIQTLPTRQRARTLAVNPSSGEVYLVTDLMAVDLGKPGGIGTLKLTPAAGSFQVLVIGN